MRRVSRSFVVVAAAVCVAASPARIEYFTTFRDVRPQAANVQNYAVVDRHVWQDARLDLGDLRLYDGSGEVPYSLQVERAESNSEQVEVKLLNLGVSGSQTSFVVDANEVPEYDDLTLKLSAKDFVSEATVEGADELPASRWTRLTTGTLFDFSREKLGNSFTLRFPPSRFRYLRVRIADDVRPNQVEGATLARQEERQANWTHVATSLKTESADTRDTVYILETFPSVPVERVEFVVTPSAVNFRRQVEVRDSENQLIVTGTITRIRLKRGTSTAEKESLAVNLPAETRSKRYEIAVRNGDDRPLPIEEVRLLSLERRMYFTPPSGNILKLYYGDPKLSAPTYDYAKLFEREANAAVAKLGSPEQNPLYTGRPDDRPWSERHRWVLWGALFIAVLGLGAVALRSLKRPIDPS